MLPYSLKNSNVIRKPVYLNKYWETRSSSEVETLDKFQITALNCSPELGAEFQPVLDKIS